MNNNIAAKLYKSKYIMIVRILLLLSLLSLSNLSFGQVTDKPLIQLLHPVKLFECDLGGIQINSGYVICENQNEKVIIKVFLQKNDGSWDEKTYFHVGSGEVSLMIEDCEYTGNAYAFAKYAVDSSPFPNIEIIEKEHDQKKHKPKFRVLRRTKSDSCPTGGVYFATGELMTHSGETVRITLFLQQKDAQWRKVSYTVKGTGIFELDELGCDLTGEYKSMLEIKE